MYNLESEKLFQKQLGESLHKQPKFKESADSWAEVIEDEESKCVYSMCGKNATYIIQKPKKNNFLRRCLIKWDSYNSLHNRTPIIKNGHIQDYKPTQTLSWMVRVRLRLLTFYLFHKYRLL